MHIPAVGAQLPPAATQRPLTQQPPSRQVLPAQQIPPALPHLLAGPSAARWSPPPPGPSGTNPVNLVGRCRRV
jgi:hypothetical protein